MKYEKILNQPTVETDRVDLRPLRGSDAALIERHAGDERVARMTTAIPHPLPQGAAVAFIERALDPERTEDVWAIDASKTGGAAMAGLISLERMDRNQSEIGYWVAPEFWNTGLASDAVAALVSNNPLENETFFAAVFQDNPASARVLTQCGFEYLGDAEYRSVARDAVVPTWTYLRKL